MKKNALQEIHMARRERFAFLPPVVEAAPFYLKAEDYDPVLRDHCKMRGKECVVPAAAIQRPGRRGAVRIL